MQTSMTIVLMVQILAALVMSGLILVQHGKGAEMGAAFGSGSSGSLFGASGSANFLSRMTAVAATVFFASTLVMAFMASSGMQRGTTTDDQGGTSVFDSAVPLTAPAPTPAPSTVPGADGSVLVPGATETPASSDAPTSDAAPSDATSSDATPAASGNAATSNASESASSESSATEAPAQAAEQPSDSAAQAPEASSTPSTSEAGAADKTESAPENTPAEATKTESSAPAAGESNAQ